MKILVSRCLLGINCRYDGGNNLIANLKSKFKGIEFVDICPEVDSKMETPRNPSEISEGKVLDKSGKDVTDFFEKGAQIALDVAQKENIKFALLKAKSPSCGSNYIYDGTFTGKIIKSDGKTAELLKKNGISVFTENELDELYEKIKDYIH